MDNKIHDIQEIIIRYLDGSATLEEKQKLLLWLKALETNRNDFIEIRDLWFSSDNALTDEEEINQALERLKARIQQAYQPAPSGRKFFLSYWQQIAVVVIVVISLGYGITARYALRNTAEGEDVRIVNQLITATGSKGRFVLPDSTVVWLNSGSKLVYPEPFDLKRRTVTLEGEAYFQVKENKKHPFVVDAGEVEIEVLGTSFNVANHPALSTVETVLLSGSIKARLPKTGQEATLTPDQLLTYEKSTGKAQLVKTSSCYHVDWIKDRLTFDNERLSDILISLEGWYTVNIDCPKTFVDRQRMSFTVRGENLEEILYAMSLIIPIHYTIERHQVRLVPRKT
jgi:ferric-dicitrate binding protein FerR (iron transport regulator)